MKKTILLLAFTLALFSNAMACHFEFSTDNGDKKSCKAGEVFVLNVKLVLTHRSCTVLPSQTKFKIDGIQVIEPGEWKQESPTVYVRKIKVKVLSVDKKIVSLLATRSCDKDGGSGLFTLEKK